jgi:hypothetical protein
LRVSPQVDKLYAKEPLIDEFHCSDSVCEVVSWLEAAAAERGGAKRVHVMPCAPLIAQWIKSRGFPQQAAARPEARL